MTNTTTLAPAKEDEEAEGTSSSSLVLFLPPLMRTFFWFGAIGPLPPIVLYIFFTSDTIEHFNGQVSSTSLFWCSTNAASDATISFLCFSVLYYYYCDYNYIYKKHNNNNNNIYNQCKQGMEAMTTAYHHEDYPNPEIPILVLRAFAVYAIFHWGSCWYWSVHEENNTPGGGGHPLYLKVAYPISIGMSLVAMIYWTIIIPPEKWNHNHHDTTGQNKNTGKASTTSYQHMMES